MSEDNCFSDPPHARGKRHFPDAYAAIFFESGADLNLNDNNSNISALNPANPENPTHFLGYERGPRSYLAGNDCVKSPCRTGYGKRQPVNNAGVRGGDVGHVAHTQTFRIGDESNGDVMGNNLNDTNNNNSIGNDGNDSLSNVAGRRSVIVNSQKDKTTRKMFKTNPTFFETTQIHPDAPQYTPIRKMYGGSINDNSSNFLDWKTPLEENEIIKHPTRRLNPGVSERNNNHTYSVINPESVPLEAVTNPRHKRIDVANQIQQFHSHGNILAMTETPNGNDSTDNTNTLQSEHSGCVPGSNTGHKITERGIDIAQRVWAHVKDERSGKYNVKLIDRDQLSSNSGESNQGRDGAAAAGTYQGFGMERIHGAKKLMFNKDVHKQTFYIGGSSDGDN